MFVIRFLHNWSITWGGGRYEIRLWRHYPWKIEFLNYGRRIR